MFPISCTTTEAERKREWGWINAVTADLPIFFPASFFFLVAFHQSLFVLIDVSVSFIFYLFISCHSVFLTVIIFLLFLLLPPPLLIVTTMLQCSGSRSPTSVLAPFPQTETQFWDCCVCLQLFGALNAFCLSKGTGLTHTAATTSFYFGPKTGAKSACPQWDIAEENSGLLVLSLALFAWFSKI